MSALPPKADMAGGDQHARFVPISSASASNSARRSAGKRISNRRGSVHKPGKYARATVLQHHIIALLAPGKQEIFREFLKPSSHFCYYRLRRSLVIWGMSDKRCPISAWTKLLRTGTIWRPTRAAHAGARPATLSFSRTRKLGRGGFTTLRASRVRWRQVAPARQDRNAGETDGQKKYRVCEAVPRR